MALLACSGGKNKQSLSTQPRRRTLRDCTAETNPSAGSVAPFRDIHDPSKKLPFAQRLEATLCGRCRAESQGVTVTRSGPSGGARSDAIDPFHKAHPR
jgi:hypothetical protein